MESSKRAVPGCPMATCASGRAARTSATTCGRTRRWLPRWKRGYTRRRPVRPARPCERLCRCAVARASKRDNRRAAPKPPPDGYELALKLLALRPHSTMELGRKLRQRGCSGARGGGYLDDAAFARALGAQRSTARGPALIAAELAAKGVPRSLARAALESLGREEQGAGAGRLAARIGPGAPSRAAARLQRRGFAGNVIREALDGSLDDLGAPEPE